MLRKTLLLLCMAASVQVMAQDAKMAPSKTTEKKDDHVDYKQPGAPMPQLLMITYYDSISNVKDHPLLVDSKDLDNGANLFVMMFNPTCSHCQNETMDFEKVSKLFKKTKLVLLANKTMRPYMKDFFIYTHLTLKDNPEMLVGIDSLDFINDAYRYQMLPQINIYDANRKLIKIYNGDVSIDSLKEYIQ